MSTPTAHTQTQTHTDTHTHTTVNEVVSLESFAEAGEQLCGPDGVYLCTRVVSVVVAWMSLG